MLAASLLTACTVHRVPEGLAEQPACTTAEASGGIASDEIAWVLRSEPAERSALDAWCWAVGPAVWLQRSTTLDPPGADSVAVVSWNAEVGHGSLPELIADLRSGALTGSPARHFVLLLQEVHRAGGAVPAHPPVWAAMPRGVGNTEDPERLDVLEVARREGLALFYAPSMRNGAKATGGVPEDRGNAILSTLPLREPLVLELPYERQRRAAILASIDVLDATRQPMKLRVASVHLDNRARFARIHRTLGDARLNQVRLVAEHIAGEEPTVVGGDLNTWVPGADEAVVRVLRAALPLPATIPPEGTLELPSVLPRLRVDHLFFRLPARWGAGYRVATRTYGSDHYPLLGWISSPPDTDR